jgi:hypothetical protein
MEQSLIQFYYSLLIEAQHSMSFVQNIVNDTNNRLRGNKPQQGSETRSSILPSAVPTELGFFGSPYNPADAMKTPTQLNIRVGSSISDVVNAVKGVGFYTDQIGFGAPSTGLTNGMPLQPLGVNYFLNTGAICSNGAQMWEYIKGIPDGSALGEKMKSTMAQMGLPPLKGLAPGMIEDMKRALDPGPLITSVFGSGYPQCRLVEQEVGDAYGRIQDPDTGELWISDKASAYFSGGKWKQRKWVQDVNSKTGAPVLLSRDEWVATTKTHHPDGRPKQREGFEPLQSPYVVVALGVICFLTFSMIRHRK